MSGEEGHAYVLVAIQAGKEQEFANEVVSKGLILDSEVEKVDFVHGDFDFIVILRGTTYEIDRRILEVRKLPYVQSTETLIPFEMLHWDDISAPFTQPKIIDRGLRSLELELIADFSHPIVLYSTKGGCTRKVAVEIASELNCPCIEISAHSDSSTVNLDNFDLVLVGTGIYQTRPNADMVRFLQNANLDGKKQFALFLTWYRLGKSDSSVFNKMDAILEASGKNLLSCYFECLGDSPKGHPNAEDLSAARKWVSKIAKRS